MEDEEKRAEKDRKVKRDKMDGKNVRVFERGRIKHNVKKKRRKMKKKEKKRIYIYTE